MYKAVDSVGLDGRELKDALNRSHRRRKIYAFLLVVPPLIFILIAFVYPMGVMFSNSFYDPTVNSIIPKTSTLLSEWDSSEGLPSEEVYASLIEEIIIAKKNRTMGRLGTRLNFEKSGMLSLIKSTARKASSFSVPYKSSVIDYKSQWGDLEVWIILKRLSSATSERHFLYSFDFGYDDKGEIIRKAEEERVFIKMFMRTLFMSFVVSFATLILGFPIAHLLATMKRRYANLVMIMVLLPFWTSLLVRTTSWIVLLQKNGVLNDLLVWIGLVSEDNRLSMMFNMEGTIIAMTQILLPFAILPMYSVMRTIPSSYMRAARSLGATQFYAFFRVYLPCTLPGVTAGIFLVFILSIGYYITPALIGGDKGMMISNLIAFHMQKTLNWSLAAALASITLIGVLILYWLYDKLVGLDSLKLG